MKARGVRVTRLGAFVWPTAYAPSSQTRPSCSLRLLQKSPRSSMMQITVYPSTLTPSTQSSPGVAVFITGGSHAALVQANDMGLLATRYAPPNEDWYFLEITCLSEQALEGGR